MSATVESAIAPFQYAFSTRVGCECIAHSVQRLTDLDPNTTIISTRAAMLDGLMIVEGKGQAVPFVRMFYGSPSSSLWEDASGVTHMIPRGGLLGTSALETIQEDLNDNEFLFAFLDDIHIATAFHRVGDVYKPLD